MTTGGKNIENVDRGRETKYVSGLVMMRRGRTNFFSWIRVDVSFCSWCCAVIYNKRFKKFKKKHSTLCVTGTPYTLLAINSQFGWGNRWAAVWPRRWEIKFFKIYLFFFLSREPRGNKTNNNKKKKKRYKNICFFFSLFSKRWESRERNR